ncbi:hypothetical protein ABZ473_31895 [Streptomyces cellulosae]
MLHAKQSLLSESIHDGISGLVEEITLGSQEDLPRLCALGLIACTAAAELDDYETCNVVLNKLLHWVNENSSTSQFLRAVLLQQRSLRLRDSGQEFAQDSIVAAQILDRLSPEEFPTFPLSPGVLATSRDTMQHVITAVQRAAWSLVPREFSMADDSVPGHIPSRMERVRMPSTIQLLEVDRLRAHEYSQFLNASFKRAFRSRARTIGASVPSLFHAALSLELLGDGSVYHARKEVALMRLVQGVSEPGLADWADSLRLLRHAGASSELDLVLNRIRSAGPLSALSKDARQILLHRGESVSFRQVELKVLQAAAELLTSAEASPALDAVIRVIDHGGPVPFPGTWQRSIIGLESAWHAAAALANVTGKQGVVAKLLLDAARQSEPEDDLRDRSIARSMEILDWDGVSSDIKDQWVGLLEDETVLLPHTREVVQLLAGVTPTSVEIADLNALAQRLNAAMNGTAMSRDLIAAGVEMTRQELSRIRAQAKSGMWTMGGVNVADIAASLISDMGVQELWVELSGFLLDSSVQRADRSRAFDRLAANASTARIPEAFAEEFKRSADVVLQVPDREIFSGDDLVPYPAALRFYACHGLMDEPQAFSHIAKLAGSDEAAAREEAAKTVAAVADVRADTWLVAFAVQLSHDGDVRAKANAGRALAVLAARRPDFDKFVSGRLLELLNEDGLLVPLFVLRELATVHGDISTPVREEIRHLKEAHPSRLVRETAKRVIA